MQATTHFFNKRICPGSWTIIVKTALQSPPLHLQCRPSSAAPGNRGKSRQVTRIRTLRPPQPHRTSREKALPCIFILYCRRLQRFQHIHNEERPLSRYATYSVSPAIHTAPIRWIDYCFFEKFLLAEVHTHMYTVFGGNVCKGGCLSRTVHTSWRFYTSTSSTDLPYSLVLIKSCLSPSFSEFLPNTFQAKIGISCGIALFTQLGCTSHPINLLWPGGSRQVLAEENVLE